MKKVNPGLSVGSSQAPAGRPISPAKPSVVAPSPSLPARPQSAAKPSVVEAMKKEAQMGGSVLAQKITKQITEKVENTTQSEKVNPDVHAAAELARVCRHRAYFHFFVELYEKIAGEVSSVGLNIPEDVIIEQCFNVLQTAGEKDIVCPRQLENAVRMGAVKWDDFHIAMGIRNILSYAMNATNQKIQKQTDKDRIEGLTLCTVDDAIATLMTERTKQYKADPAALNGGLFASPVAQKFIAHFKSKQKVVDLTLNPSMQNQLFSTMTKYIESCHKRRDVTFEFANTRGYYYRQIADLLGNGLCRPDQVKAILEYENRVLLLRSAAAKLQATLQSYRERLDIIKVWGAGVLNADVECRRYTTFLERTKKEYQDILLQLNHEFRNEPDTSSGRGFGDAEHSYADMIVIWETTIAENHRLLKMYEWQANGCFTNPEQLAYSATKQIDHLKWERSVEDSVAPHIRYLASMGVSLNIKLLSMSKYTTHIYGGSYKEGGDSTAN